MADAKQLEGKQLPAPSPRASKGGGEGMLSRPPSRAYGGGGGAGGGLASPRREPRALAADHLYADDDAEVAAPMREGELPRELLALHGALGLPLWRRSNLFLLEEGVLLYSCGNALLVLDLIAHESQRNVLAHRRVVFAPRSRGIGAVAVHPSRKFVAVAEKGERPRILVLEYPSFRVARVLRDGAERGFSCLEFSAKGDKLASVSAEPDYMLTVWDWAAERVTLHAKAFAQEVFRVQFSPLSEGRLLTSGTGHIRFWRMARTFTGLKLQGAIGKFGAYEISDVSCFAELANGKVLSGSESGYLLMWDEGMAQFQLGDGEGRPCHAGAVECLVREGDLLVTAGRDGYVRAWECAQLEFAEPSDADRVLRLRLVRERLVAEGAAVRFMVRSRGHWLVQDENSGLFRLDAATFACERVVAAHARQVTGAIFSPLSHTAVTCGADGTVRVWDAARNALVASRAHSAGATCMLALPRSIDPLERSVAVGFEDGVVRVLTRFRDGFQLIKAVKPHSQRVLALAWSPSGKLLASSGADGTIFFVAPAQAFAPIGFVRCAAPATHLCWRGDSARLLAACGAQVVELPAPSLEVEDEKKRETFEIHLACVAHSLALPPVAEPADSAVSQSPQAVDGAVATAAAPAKPVGKPIVVGRGAAKGKGEEDAAADARAALAEWRPIAPPPRVAALAYNAEGSGFWASLDAPDPLAARAAEELPMLAPAALAMATAMRRQRDHVYEFALPRDAAATPTLLPSRSIDLGEGAGAASALAFDKQLMLIGTLRGAVQVRALAAPARGVCLQVLDGDVGGVAALALSQDARLLLVGGRDSSLFAFRLDAARVIQAAKADNAAALIAAAPPAELTPLDETVPELASVATPGAVDIASARHYSLEEAKQKQERDEQVAASERAKEAVRAQLKQLRSEFQSLVSRNQALAPEARLPRSAFELDPQLRRRLEEEVAATVERVRGEMAWDTARRVRALEKLRQRFLDPLLVEHITVHAFRSGLSVSTLRARELPAALQSAIEDVHALVAEEVRRQQQQQQQQQQQRQQDLQQQQQQLLQQQQQQQQLEEKDVVVVDKSGAPAAPSRSLAAEQRRRLREERRQRRAALEAEKPDEARADPADSEARRVAAETIGDYKLKSDANYIVPESRRVDAERKRRQMVLLAESAHLIRMGLNERVLALRDLKKRLLETVSADQSALRAIDAELGEERALAPAICDPAEWPELRSAVTPEQVAAFQRERKRQEEARLAALRGGIFAAQQAASGGGGGGGGEDDTATAEAEARRRERESAADASSVAGGGGGGAGGGDAGSVAAARSVRAGHHRVRSDASQMRASFSQPASPTGVGGLSPASPPPTGDAAAPAAAAAAAAPSPAQALASRPPLSQLEQAEAEARRRELRARRAALERKIEEALSSFDAAVGELRAEKARLDADLKSAELRLLTLYRELNLLREFEGAESALLARLDRARASKASVVAELATCERDLAARLEEVESWQLKDKQVLEEFQTLVGGGRHEAYAQLLRIFKKKVKRQRRRRARRGGDADDEDEADVGEEEEEEDASGGDGEGNGQGAGDDEGESEDDEESCPVGCDSVLYERVLELREKRLDQEDVLAEINAAVNDLNKRYQQHRLRERGVDKELRAVEAELQRFQCDKQRALNQVPVCVPLRLSQLKVLEHGALPADATAALVFAASGLRGLQRRIGELQEEKQSLRGKLRDLRREHRQMEKDNQARRAAIEAERQRSVDVQLLKFGQTVDVALLTRAGAGEEAEEVRQRLRALEQESATRVHEWEVKLRAARKSLTSATVANTLLLQRVGELTAAQYELEDELNAATRNVHVAEGGPQSGRAEAEREALEQLVRVQEAELEGLRAEAHVLRRKGGRVYLQVQPQQAE